MKTSVCKYFIIAILLAIHTYIASATTEGDNIYLPSESYLLPDSITSSHQHFKISYRLNRHEIDTAYMNNRENIRRMRISLSNPMGIDSIVIYSFASPEGPLQNNIRLACERGKSAGCLIRDIIAEKHVAIGDEKIKIRVRGENWDDLHTIVSKTYHGEDRDKLLSILNSSESQEEKKRQIKRLGNKTWRFIIDKLMPHLRSSEIVCIYHSDFIMSRIDYSAAQIMQVPVAPRVYTAPLTDMMTREPEMITEKRTRIAAKTNMLYDAVTWTNISAEVPFKIKDHKFSITYDHQFPWWRVGEGNNKYCNRYLQIGGEARWWFAPLSKPRTKDKIVRECLTGHFVGLYGMGGKYDFEWGRKICYQGEFWSTGVTYGYAMPISKLFNLEFSVSLGYASIDYRHFIPSEDYDILYRDVDKMGRLDYFGVTKLGVSLVMPINFKHKVKGKEGRR